MAKAPEGFYRRGEIWWWRTDPITRQRHSSGKKTIREAQLVLAERRRILAGSTDATGARKTISDWCSAVIQEKRTNNPSGTVNMYRTKLGHVVRIFGGSSSVLTIEPASVDRFVAQRRAEGASTNTIGKELTGIRQLLAIAKRAGCYPGDIRSIQPRGFRNDYVPGERFLTAAELDKLLAVLKSKRAAQVAFMVATGARWSESVHALAEDLSGDQIRIRGTKTGLARRVVPVISIMRGLLVRVSGHLPFHGWSNVHRDLEDACKAAGIPSVTPNDLRRTTATWLIEGGVEASVVARVLGHRDSRMVERVYGKMRPAELGRVIEAQLGVVRNASVTPGVTITAVQGDLPGVRGRNRTSDTRIFSPNYRTKKATVSRDTARKVPSDSPLRPTLGRGFRTGAVTLPAALRGYPPPILAQCGNVYFGRFQQRRLVRVSVPPGTLIRIDRVRGGAA